MCLFLQYQHHHCISNRFVMVYSIYKDDVDVSIMQESHVYAIPLKTNYVFASMLAADRRRKKENWLCACVLYVYYREMSYRNKWILFLLRVLFVFMNNSFLRELVFYVLWVCVSLSSTQLTAQPHCWHTVAVHLKKL